MWSKQLVLLYELIKNTLTTTRFYCYSYSVVGVAESKPPEVCRYTHLVWETSVHTVLHEYAASMYNNDVRVRDEWLLRLEVPICVSILGGYPDTVQKLSTSGHTPPSPPRSYYFDTLLLSYAKFINQHIVWDFYSLNSRIQKTYSIKIKYSKKIFPERILMDMR